LGGNGEAVRFGLSQLEAAFPDHTCNLLHYGSYTGSNGKPTEAALVAGISSLFNRIVVAHIKIKLVRLSIGTGITV
jgi:hypothetical protein